MNIFKKKGDGKKLKLTHVFDKKRLLLVFLVASILSSLTTVSVPVHAGHTDEHVWVEPAVKPGEAVGTVFNVSVWIENAWDMVGWAMSVHVDPNVLEVMGASEGPFIGDFVAAWNAEHPQDQISYDFYAYDELNKTTGYIIDTDCMIIGSGKIPVGEAANGTGMLCQYWFKSKNLTAYSLIDLFDVRVYDHTQQLYIENVWDGYYNEPPPGAIDGTVTDASTGLPIDGASITANSYTNTTDEYGYYTIADVPVGNYMVEASAAGYVSDSKPAHVESGATDTVNFTLTQKVHDVNVTNVVPSATQVDVGDPVDIDVTIKNEGNVEESFTLNVYAGADLVETKTPTLAAGTTETYTFTWTTTAIGNFSIKAEVPPVPDEVDTIDNTWTTTLWCIQVVPEFPILMPLLLALAILAVSTIVLKRKPLRSRRHQVSYDTTVG